MSLKSTASNRQVQRTKSWIFEAIMLLMNEKPYGKITVSDITEKAGIARQTFYRNYDNKDEVVFEYLLNTINTDLLNIKEGEEPNTIILVLDYQYIIKHQKYLICRYKLCYQVTGCLRVFFDWFINNMPMPIESIISMLNAMNVPKTVQYRNIPSFLVQL